MAISGIDFKNSGNFPKILKSIKKFPQGIVDWELTKNGIRAYVCKSLYRLEKSEENLKLVSKFPQWLVKQEQIDCLYRQNFFFMLSKSNIFQKWIQCLYNPFFCARKYKIAQNGNYQKWTLLKVLPKLLATNSGNYQKFTKDRND